MTLDYQQLVEYGVIILTSRYIAIFAWLTNKQKFRTWKPFRREPRKTVGNQKTVKYVVYVIRNWRMQVLKMCRISLRTRWCQYSFTIEQPLSVNSGKLKNMYSHNAAFRVPQLCGIQSWIRIYVIHCDKTIIGIAKQ